VLCFEYLHSARIGGGPNVIFFSVTYMLCNVLLLVVLISMVYWLYRKRRGDRAFTAMEELDDEDSSVTSNVQETLYPDVSWHSITNTV